MKTLSPTAPIAPVTAVKSVLARLLATENISVEHQDVPTAAFDLRTRTLILPRWKDMSNALYDMLVGHEVSHALHTPQDGWKSDADALALKHGVDGGVARQYLNIAEDARIERMIKDKFPGLRSDFFKGYGELHAKNFFGVTEAQMPSLALGDRVNLHSKLGLHVDAIVPFTADEAPIRDFVMGAQTWADTVEGADRMLAVDAAKWKQKQEPQERAPEGQSAPQGDETEDGEDAPGADGEDSQGGEGEDKSESGSGTDSGEDNSQGRANDNPTETQTGEDDQGGSGGEKSMKSDMPGPITNSSLENSLKSLNETASRAPNVVRLKMTAPTLDVVVPFADVLKDLNEMATRGRWNPAPVREADYKRASSAMATAFDRRKSADIWKRTTVAKTGAIDPLRMTQYKWNEDIFRRGTRIAEGKNHGIVILLDWSGSMGSIMQQTIGQLMILTDFCRMAGVPFEVYAFCDRAYTVLPEGMDQYSDEAYRLRDKEYNRFNSKEHNTASPTYMRLLNFLSNRMTAAQYERMKSLLFNHWSSIGYDSRYGMGSTPTAAALHHASAVVAEFTKRNRIQIAHTIVLTDGDATDEYRVNRGGDAVRSSWTRDTHWVIEDPTTGASYDLWNTQYRDADGKTQTMRRGSVNWEAAANRSVCIAIDALRRRTGCKVHWIGLSGSTRKTAPSGMGGFVPFEDSNWGRDGFARGTAAGWDTAVMAASCRFGGAGNNWIEKQLEAMDDKIEGAKTSRTLVNAVVDKQAMTNSLRSLATIIGEFIAVA